MNCLVLDDTKNFIICVKNILQTRNLFPLLNFEEKSWLRIIQTQLTRLSERSDKYSWNILNKLKMFKETYK